MDTSSFDKDITECETKLSHIKELMEECSSRFIDAASPFLAGWFQEQIDKGVNDNPTSVKEIGRDNIKQLQAELARIKSDLPNWVQSELSQKKYWLHKQDKPDYYKGGEYRVSRAHDGGLPSVFNTSPVWRALALIRGKVISPLRRNKLLPNNIQAFCQTDTPADSGLLYKGPATISEDMKAALDEYCKRCDEASKVCNELSKVQRQKDQAEAVEIWKNP